MKNPFSKSKPAIQLDDEKIGKEYEQDSTRITNNTSRNTNNKTNSSGGINRLSEGRHPRDKYIGSFAPNPAFIQFLRFILYTLTSISSIATAALGLSVTTWYSNHRPSIPPAWGSLIAEIVIGILTPILLFGIFFFTPRLFRHGGVGAILNQTRFELFLLFSLSAIWISTALAVACDLRGQENCIWDGYYHYVKPADFQNVCKLINTSVILGYITFGLCCIQMVVFFTAVIYILLYLDQEVLTEPTHDAGGRAYRARILALAQYQTRRNAQSKGISTAGPFVPPITTAGGGTGGGTSIHTSSGRSLRNLNAGPMAGGVESIPVRPKRNTPPNSSMDLQAALDQINGVGNHNGSGSNLGRRASLDRYRDEENGSEGGLLYLNNDHRQNENENGQGSGYYGHERRDTHV